MLRSANFKVTAVFVDQEVIDVEAGDTTELRYGIAYDLGTLLRYAAYCVANDFTGQVLTIYQWAKQNGYQ